MKKLHGRIMSDEKIKTFVFTGYINTTINNRMLAGE